MYYLFGSGPQVSRNPMTCILSSLCTCVCVLCVCVCVHFELFMYVCVHIAAVAASDAMLGSWTKLQGCTHTRWGQGFKS